MKELSIEEKAKCYDEAIERAKSLLSGNQLGNAWIYKLLPELKESEDERIRNFISNELACLRATDEKGSDRYEELTNAIAWLEKQGEQKIDPDTLIQQRVDALADIIAEQKPIDKVEPKFNFKVNQWIVATGKCVYLIAKIDGFNVTLVDTNGDEYVFDTSSLNDAHEWTIQDAKDGDVLAYPDGSITLFKHMAENLYMAHVLWVDGHIELNNSCAISNAHPATKEQRDTLIKAMTDAGYTFDFESKELKKIQQKSAWSEEDERMLENTIGLIEVLDRETRNAYTTKEYIDWLKSLRPQNRWKPSDEQMDALETVTSSLQSTALESLYNDLKKLREE